MMNRLLRLPEAEFYRMYRYNIVVEQPNPFELGLFNADVSSGISSRRYGFEESNLRPGLLELTSMVLRRPSIPGDKNFQFSLNTSAQLGQHPQQDLQS